MIRHLTILVAAASPLAAEPFLDWPVDCTPGLTCFIEDYVDNDPGQGAKDFTCGLNTRDAHKGTDIALFSFDDVARGVSVRAAADGVVRRTRDEMPDDRLMRGVTDQTACGNAVLIAHGNGYETLYCHLRLGSVTVAPGQTVAAGDPLGLIGLSGQTTHPHLHMTVYRNGAVVDPFRPEATGSCGGLAQATLWTDPPVYHRTLLRLAGFSDGVPDYDALRGGTARRDVLRPDQPMVVYAEAGYAEHGDVITLTATGPEGEVFRQTRVMTNPRASQLPAFGKRAPDGGWPAGEYLGQITLTRDGQIIANRWAHVTVE